MMTWKQIAWHFFRLALAAVLLALDVRFFFFYAFSILLTLMHRVDYVRAEVRVFQTANDVRFILLMQKAGVTETEMRALAGQVELELPERARKTLLRDFRWVMPEAPTMPSHLA